MKQSIKEDEDIISSASQTATSAIHRLTMEDELASSSSSSSSPMALGGRVYSPMALGGRAIDRCNPIIRDATRLGKVAQPTSISTKPPSSPQQPTTKLKHHNENSKENMFDIYQTKKAKKKKTTIKKGKKATSSAECGDKMVSKSSSSSSINSKASEGDYEISVNSPGDSSRYLLTTNNSSTLDMKSFVYSHRFDPLLAVVEQSPSTSSFSSSQPTSSFSSSQPTSSSPASAAASVDQVVVLRVSLHCKGCERKMRKHISKMEGVRSFNIDFAAKKLTVVGEVTPLSVLASVSKVKKAQLLAPPPLISSCSNINTISSINKDKAILV